MSSLMEMCAYTIAEKDQQITELEKALELACEDVYVKSCLKDCRDCPATKNCSLIDHKGCIKTISDYFKAIAKQKIELNMEDNNE